MFSNYHTDYKTSASVNDEDEQKYQRVDQTKH